MMTTQTVFETYDRTYQELEFEEVAQEAPEQPGQQSQSTAKRTEGTMDNFTRFLLVSALGTTVGFVCLVVGAL